MFVVLSAFEFVRGQHKDLPHGVRVAQNNGGTDGAELDSKYVTVGAMAALPKYGRALNPELSLLGSRH